MSITYPAQPMAARRTRHVSAWLAARRRRRAQRRTEREIAELPPHLLRDIGLVNLAQVREENGGRTLDHTKSACTAQSLWRW